MTIYQRLLEIIRSQGAGFLVLLDPDNEPPPALGEKARRCQEAGVDALLIGGSTNIHNGFQAAVEAIKGRCDLPLIIFPGSAQQLSAQADALLLLSLISGRNPRWLIEEHVQAAPVIKRYGLETIPTGYLLVSSGTSTEVERVSGTQPLPRNDAQLAAAHALAGQYLGMKLIYLEAGSGASESVPDELIAAVRREVDLPLIVGGGLRAPEEAAAKVAAGADFVVVGTALEVSAGQMNLKSFCEAIHVEGKAKCKKQEV